MNVADLRVYLVTDSSLTGGRPLEEVVKNALEGGVTMVQLREKNLSTKEFYLLALRIKEMCSLYKVPFIVNDRLDIALACDADGLHIGQNDLPFPVARKLLGKNKIIGLSVENKDDVSEANRIGPDYIGISPVFSTPTKTDTAPPLDLEGVKELCSLSSSPAVGIGGINMVNAADVIRAGAEGVAVVSTIISADSPKDAADNLKKIVIQAKNEKI